MIESLSYLREPLWLWLSLLPLLLFVVSFIFQRYRSNQYASAKLKSWVMTTRSAEQRHRYRQFLLTQLAWIAFTIALAGPRLPEKIHDESHEYFQEVMLVLDLSLSMSARDTLPSRIERAKLEAFDLISRMQNVRLGVVVYAARPHLLTPFTYDKQALRHYLKPLRTQLLPTEGSDTLMALSFAVQQFSKTTILPRSIILISDGESNQQAEPYTQKLDDLSVQLRQNNIQLYTLGIGTQQGAALLSSHSGWLQQNNQAVVSRLQRDTLISLANMGNGIYSDVRDDDNDWALIYDKGIALKRVATTEQKINDLILWHEYFYIFVIIGTVFLLLAPLSFDVLPLKSNHSRAHPRPDNIAKTQRRLYRSSTTAALLLTGFVLLFTFNIQSTLASPLDNDERFRLAQQQFQSGEWQEARDNFAKIPGYDARFAEGAAAYKLGQYKLATTIYIQATLDANSDPQRSDSVFNLANSYFKLAEYQKAESLYQDVLRYQPRHPAAVVNLSYAKALYAKQKEDELPPAKRTGSGPRTANAPADMDITNSTVSLGDSSSTETDLTLSETEVTSSQLESTLEHSAPASQKIETIKDESWSYDITNLSVLQQKAPRIQPDEAILWQRLFEVEESFEAAQEKPKVLPGVKPW